MNKIDKIIRHARKANQIIFAAHQLCTFGNVDVTEGKPWDYDWVLLEALTRIIPTMKVTNEVKSTTSYNGCWTRKEILVDENLFGERYKGTLVLSRSGGGLENTHWDFIEQ